MPAMPSPSESCITFEEAVRFIEGAIDYEKITAYKYDAPTFDLGRVRRILDCLGGPHERLRCVHVAGTKGKGTTSALLAAVLHRAGFRTGLFTSPHLLSVTERIIVDGRPISQADFAARVADLRRFVEWERLADLFQSPTYFEMLTAIGFQHFAQLPVDYAVVEVGLGGRLDSTNVIAPGVAVITAIGWDHMDKLGRTLEAIASEKAGIIKPGATAVLGAQRYRKALERLLCRAEQLADRVLCYGRDFAVSRPEPTLEDGRPGWRFTVTVDHPWLGRFRYEDLHLPLLGRHQIGNAATAIVSALALARRDGFPLAADQVAAGLACARWPGRVDFIGGRPPIIVDAAHTLESAEALLDALRTHFPGIPRCYVFACSRDKDVVALLRTLGRDGSPLVLTAYGMARAAPPEELAAVARRVIGRRCAVLADSREALEKACTLAGENGLVCVVGSFFLAAEIYRHLLSTGRCRYPL